MKLAWKKGKRSAGPRCAIGLEENRQSPNRNHPKGTSGWDSVRKPHGLTAAEARDFREGKACEICGTSERLCVDHCHTSGLIRGVLCAKCNAALGLFRDNVTLLAMAVVYLSTERSGTIQEPLVSLEG